MAFPLHSFERILSDICKKGTQRGFTTVPESTLAFTWEDKQRKKKPDVIWLSTLDDVDGDDIPDHKIVAVFELEGFNVPKKTIKWHSTAYPAIWAGPALNFPCYIPLYSLAVHRPGYGGNPAAIQKRLQQRVNWATENGAYVKVCDGRVRNWLDHAADHAHELAQQWRAAQQ